MSYSIQYATAEQEQEIVNAINSRDCEALFKLADIIKEQGDDENAEALLTEAKRFEKEDWMFDQERDNNL